MKVASKRPPVTSGLMILMIIATQRNRKGGRYSKRLHGDIQINIVLPIKIKLDRLKILRAKVIISISCSSDGITIIIIIIVICKRRKYVGYLKTSRP